MKQPRVSAHSAMSIAAAYDAGVAWRMSKRMKNTISRPGSSGRARRTPARRPPVSAAASARRPAARSSPSECARAGCPSRVRTTSSSTAATSPTTIISFVCCARHDPLREGLVQRVAVELVAEFGTGRAADRRPHEPQVLVLEPQALDQTVQRNLADAVGRQPPPGLVFDGRRAEHHQARARREVGNRGARDERRSHHVRLQHLAPRVGVLVGEQSEARWIPRCAVPRRSHRGARRPPRACATDASSQMSTATAYASSDAV